MSRAEIVRVLCDLRACDGSPSDALPWARSLPEAVTWHDAWQLYERGDHMLWFLPRIGVDRHWVVAGACACARGVAHLMCDPRSIAALDVAERWSHGLATDAELDDARSAADAAYTADAAAAYAAYTATAAAGAACAAAAYTADADADAARSSALRSCAKRVRRVVPWRIVDAALAQHLRRSA